MLGDIASSYVTAGMSGKLGGAKGLLKGDLSFGEALTGQSDWAGSMASGDIGGWSGAKEGIADLISFKDEGGNEIAQDYDTGQADQIIPSFEDQSLAMDQESEVILDDGYSYANGGQVIDQNTLIGLAILSEMANQKTAYNDTPLEEEEQQQTISDMFASQGKTLGGSNTQSLSQILGR